MNSENTSRFPYQDCLVPSLPEETQHQLLNIAHYIVRPLDILLAAMSFVCNAFVCIAVARTKSLQKPSFLMLSSLSMTYLILSLYSLLRDIGTSRMEHMCPQRTSLERVLLPFLYMCVLASLGNLALISRDRYLAVTKPWWHRNHVTKSRAVKLVSVQWLISAVLALGIYLYKMFEGGISRIGQILPLLYFFVCCLVIIFSYLGLLCKKSSHDEGHDIRAILKREKELANTVGLIILALLLTSLPAVLSPLALLAAGFKNRQPFRPFYILLFQLNGLLNPLLSIGRSRDMRRALKHLLKCSALQVQPSTSGCGLGNRGILEQNGSTGIPLEPVTHATY